MKSLAAHDQISFLYLFVRGDGGGELKPHARNELRRRFDLARPEQHCGLHKRALLSLSVFPRSIRHI